MNYKRGVRRIKLIGLWLMICGTAPICLGAIFPSPNFSLFIVPSLYSLIIGLAIFAIAFAWEGFLQP